MTEKRVALISGANRGIGAAIAADLADRGWDLSLGMRKPQLPDWSTAAAIHLHAYDAQVATAEDHWVASALDHFGRIDAIIANAGIMIPKNVIDIEESEIDDLFAINVKAPRRLAKAAWSALASSGKGRVIIVASLSGKRVKSESSGSYAVSKFAAVALAHALRHAGFDLGIRATAVCPGYVATDMASNLTKLRKDQLTAPSDIAHIIAMLLDLPNEASVAEFHVNCQLDSSF